MKHGLLTQYGRATASAVIYLLPGGFRRLPCKITLPTAAPVILVNGISRVSAQSYGLVDKPLRLGIATRVHFGTTARLANDSDIVGSPPNCPILLCTHFKPATRSRMPTLPDASESLTGHRKIGKPDRPQTMIDGYEHDVTITADIFAIITILFNTITVGEAASM